MKNRPKIINKSIKNHPKSMKIGQNRLLGPSWRGMGAILAPRWPQEPTRARKVIFCPPPKDPQVGGQNPPNWEVWGHVGAIWAPCWPPKSYQDDINFFNHFGIVFGSILKRILEGFSEPKLVILGLKIDFKRLCKSKPAKTKNRPKTP